MSLYTEKLLKNTTRPKLMGDVFLSQPTSTALISAVVVSLVFIIAAFLALGSYARMETVPGHIVPSEGLIKIRTPQFSILDELHVREGDEVSAGQLLATLKLDQATETGQSSESNILLILNNQMQSLDERIANQLALQQSTQAELALQKTALIAEKSFFSEQAQIKQNIYSHGLSTFDNLGPLIDEGFISDLEAKRQEQALLQQQAELNLAEQQLAMTDAKIEQIQFSIEKVPQDFQERVAELQQQLVSLQTSIEEIKARQSITITAPMNGIVTALNVHSPGVNLLGQTVLLTLLPQNAELQAELFIPSRAMGFIKEGDEVRLMYDAFPYQHFGSYEARIERISESILNLNELNNQYEVQLREPSFRVIASIEDMGVVNENTSLRLQSGMGLNANIILERRSLMDWLFEPLNGFRHRS